MCLSCFLHQHCGHALHCIRRWGGQRLFAKLRAYLAHTVHLWATGSTRGQVRRKRCALFRRKLPVDIIEDLVVVFTVLRHESARAMSWYSASWPRSFSSA